MSKKEFILENFIGLPYQEQLNLLSYLNQSVKDFGTKKVIREFENLKPTGNMVVKILTNVEKENIGLKEGYCVISWT